MMNKSAILRRILYRIIQDRIRLTDQGKYSPVIMRALFDVENDIYQIA